MFKRMSLRTRFVLFALACLVPLSLGGVALLNLSDMRNRDLLLENEVSAANMTTRSVTSYFDRAIRSLETIASDPQVSSLDPTANLLPQAYSLNQDYSSLFLLDAIGAVVSPTKNPPSELIASLGDQVNDTIANRQVLISPRILVGDDVPVVVITVPVVTAPDPTTPASDSASTPEANQGTGTGQVVGALGASIRLDELDQLVISLASGDMDIAVVRATDDLLLGSAGPVENPAAFVQRNSEAIDQARSGRSNDFQASDGNDQDVIGYVQPIVVESYTWAVIVTRPEPTSFSESVWKPGFLILGLGALATIAAAFVLGELNTRPLRTLSRRLGLMLDGDFSERIEPVGTGEVRELSASLALMTEELAEQLDGLDDGHVRDESQTRQMRELLRRTMRLQENEQRRIASEIHDAVSPLITGALYQARALQMGNGSIPPEDREVALGQVNELLERATNELHGVIFDLRPPDLDDLGIVAAIEAYVSTIQRLSIHVRLDLGSEPEGLSPEVRLGMYRIVQEALHNLMRHSGADDALVKLETTGDNIRLTIRDNGSGFDPDVSVRPNSLGLLSMRERAEAIGAKLTIVSRPGGGTAIILERRRTDTVMSDDVLRTMLEGDQPTDVTASTSHEPAPGAEHESTTAQDADEGEPEHDHGAAGR